MNKILIDNELWPNNGHIMLEFNDYQLDLGNIDYLNYETFNRFIVINTIHEDNLEWEKEYVKAELNIYDNEKEFNYYTLKSNNEINIVDQVFPIKNSYRVGIATEWDDSSTEDYGNYIEFEKIYSQIYLKIFINNEKTELEIIGLLIK